MVSEPHQQQQQKEHGGTDMNEDVYLSDLTFEMSFISKSRSRFWPLTGRTAYESDRSC